MDIPNTGAIFTLGKSHLAENTQSYFYIKKDPVKKLISGPHQSAVICESGRLFVWGENQHGQLGIGSQSNHNNNNNTNNNSNATTTSHSDIVIKPTCVKSLKAVGLKIADIAFGNDWSIILTHSNEIFYSGRSIFPKESNAARNFAASTVADEQCAIIRKPFRIEELDDCLTKNEDAECYTSVLAGNEHFVLMTSFGRLIAWGSNQNYQLGLPHHHTVETPHEINLGAPVKQYVCGPESTLVLTTNGKLYFAGHLNEFVFSQFTELQQNLAPTEQIIFMHISQTNEIYIVTNAGSIYRSVESLRTKSLIFQRFYDYDSEENGPIWKLLKGFSFYAVLTKANKFYTTFSESGHHLKTFREISKFKNLRLLDVAVGIQHILVHGIPRFSNVSASAGAGAGSGSEPHRFASNTFVMPTNLVNGLTERSQSKEQNISKVENKNNVNLIEREASQTADLNSNMLTNGIDVDKTKLEERTREAKATIEQIKMDVTETKAEETTQKSAFERPKVEELVQESENLKDNFFRNNSDNNMSENEDFEGTNVNTAANGLAHNEAKSPSKSVKSTKSRHSVKFSPTAVSRRVTPTTDKLLRPHTPYPESSTTESTPTTIKKTPLRNYSYEAAMEHDHIDNTSPVLIDSLENISENALPFEEDEQLTVEINTTTDPQSNAIVVNEIRFINNGIDVTDNVKADSFEREDTESTSDSLEEQVEEMGRMSNETLNHLNNNNKTATEDVLAAKIQKIKHDDAGMSNKLKTEVDQIQSDVKHLVESQVAKIDETVSEKIDDLSAQADHVKETLTSAQADLYSHADNANDILTDKVENVTTKADSITTDVRNTVETAAKRAAAGARDAVETVGDNAKRVANDTMTTVESIGNSARKVANGAKNAVGNAFIKMSDGTKEAVDSVAAKISNEVQGAKDNFNTILHGKSLKPPPVDEDAVSSASDVVSKEGAKTNTTTGEDDERTTASVNSTQNSTSNPFEGSNPFESSNPFDDVVERGKKAMQNEANIVHQEVIQEAEKEKSKVRQFFNDFRGISCRNEKSVAVDDDPPLYSVEDKYPTPHREHTTNQQNNTSKVCSIL